jgi:hypothetical protein
MSDLIKSPGLFLEVANIVAKRGLSVLVETGTGPESSGMQVAKRLAMHGYTCDVYEPAAVAASERWPEFDVYHADSATMLKEVLPKIGKPTFFWLDGHCPTDPDCLPGGIFPVMDEFLLIKSLKAGYERDVIWVDDIPMITSEDNPHRSEWDVYLNAPGAGRWHGENRYSWAEYLAVFADTHVYRVDESILKLTPKEK